MEELIKYVLEHSTRGDCQCGRCIDQAGLPNPLGHTINLTFFTVGLLGEPDPETFKHLCEQAGVEAPVEEMSYIHFAGQVGDQGLAMQLMALGHLLGVWIVRSPDNMMPFLDQETKNMMAGSGMITFLRKEGAKVG